MVDRKSRLALPMLLGLLVAATLVFASPAAAAPKGAEIKAYSAEVSSTQAGAHPDLTVDFTIGTRVDKPYFECGCDQIKNALVEAPGGFIGNPHAVPECTSSQFILDECPVDSQVGTAQPYVMIGDGCCLEQGTGPVYNLVPQPGQAGLLGWKAPIVGFPIYEVISSRTGSDYGLNTETKGITAYFGLGRFRQVLWGVPASPIHDNERFKSGGNLPVAGPAESNSPERPFLSNPTSCTGPLESNLVTTGYDHGINEQTAPWPATTGCDRLNFNPSQSANPTTAAADSASGLDVLLKVPQSDSPETPSDSEIKGVTVTMPPGFSINSSAADGKTSCTDAQARFGTELEAQCPEYSKVGTLSIDSWALPDPIPGAIYLGQPLPGNRYRIFLAADGFGVHVKLPGSTYPDPATGQLRVVFENLPQSPLTEFSMHFFGSERGLLATPTQCGTYPVVSEFEPWATGLPNQTSTQFFKITSGPGGSPCPGATRPFNPGFGAAGASNGAGAHSPFSINITRRDGDQTLATVGVHTPPGFSATLKGIPYCPDSTLSAIANPGYLGSAELNSPQCPAASQVGSSWAGAGAGSKPFYAPGRVYLSGPYKGAPISFTVVTPAVSGPYDLGNVVNRVAVHVDPTTAEVTANSDPLPQIIEGIPLRLRSVLINLDRKDFTLNPTSCDPFSITGILSGDQGATAEPSAHFQVANCRSLDFEPTLKTTLTGATKRAGLPALRTVLTQPEGQSNIKRAVVSLPHSVFLAQDHLQEICTRVQFAADNCPAKSIYGRARAVSSLLDAPLEGPVYLRSSSDLLPNLVAVLKGPPEQPIEIELRGRIDTDEKEGIRTTFPMIPDAPVSKFVLQLKGGKKSLLTNSANLCVKPRYVDARFLGQNGDRVRLRPELEVKCGGKAGKRTKRAGERRGR